ncbi:50S ribosomal protein L6 [Candidatus Uhrbacteria bacterium]|nr:50S ribosomal protein L6 [Candidatus Uhrbacteria bacterium]
MSRIGKKPIIIRAGVTTTVDGRTVRVKGPKGELTMTLHPHVRVEERAGELVVTVASPDVASDRALWGLSRTLIENMVHGVTEGFKKQLEVIGIGYKVALQDRALKVEVGFSHPVIFELPTGIEAQVEKNTITIVGADRQLVGDVAAQIRSIRKPEVYKGKGIKYIDEVVRRKAGKAAKTTGAA